MLCTHTHPFNGPLSGTTQVSRYQKVKPIWFLLKQETVSGSGISWAICKSAHRSRQITTPAPHHSVFYRPNALPAAQPTASKHCSVMLCSGVNSSECLATVCWQARLRLAELVEKEDVNEAMRLMEMSKDSLNPSVEHGRSVTYLLLPASMQRFIHRWLLSYDCWHVNCPCGVTVSP